ncbi:MAG: beta-lactamase family protein [Myxococcales bacterium]|nr:beta-lactamase family protein [Myxococcales bacterium]
MVNVRGHCEPRLAAVRDAFIENFEQGGEVGASVACVVDGRTVVDLTGGHVDREKTAEWASDTLVNVFSTTKGMTALCANQLMDRGELDPDAPVAAYWPEFGAEGKDELPVRWLLSHQAGLPAIRTPHPEEVLYDWERMTQALAAERPWWIPGTRAGYHAVTFGHLVGEVVRRISGESLGAFFRRNVAEPLGVDFHIGLPESEHARVSPTLGSIVGPKIQEGAAKLTGPLADFVRDMADPTTMVGAAFNNPHQRRDSSNSAAWRSAEIPAANGHGTALAIARVYGALARGGELDGLTLLSPAAIERASTEQVFGADAVLGGMKMRYGMGFMLRHDGMPLGPSLRAFGHPGAGGSIGFADPDTKLGFGYTMNRMRAGLVGGPGAYQLIRAFYGCL